MLKIKELREEMQLTQAQLADKISNMQRNISNWENGVSQPDLDTVVALADVFDVSLDELFGREYTGASLFETSDARLIRAVRRLSPEQKAALYALLESFTATGRNRAFA